MRHSTTVNTNTKQKRSKPCGVVHAQGHRNFVRIPILISYHYLRKLGEERKRYFTHGGATADGFEVMLDSGAFSAKNAGAVIELDEYMEFVSTYGDQFTGGFVALDVLGNPAATASNLKVMWDAGLDPMPVHVWGDTAKKMDELFERASKICLGGFRRPGRGPAPKGYVVDKMRMAKGRKVHWLGYTNFDMVASLTPHSCDAMSWKTGMLFAQVHVYEGKGKMTRLGRDNVATQPISMQMKRAINDAGYTVRELQNTEQWVTNKGIHQRVTTMSWLRYVIELRQQLGTRTFMALGTLAEVDMIKVARQLIVKHGYMKEGLSDDDTTVQV